MTTIVIGPEGDGDILLLPHPRTREPTQFLLTPDGKIHELLNLVGDDKKRRSMLLSEEILSPPTHFLLATPFDPVFFLIGSFDEERETQFVEVDDLLDGWPAVLRPVLKRSLTRVAVYLEGGAGQQFCRLDEEAISSHLRAKVERVRRSLPSSLLPLETEGGEEIREMRKTRQGVDLIASYLPAGQAARLRACYDFGSLDALDAAATTTHFVDPAEFIGGGGDKSTTMNAGLKNKTGTVKKKTATTTKKVNTTGMSPMTSFFAPKPKRQKT